MRHVEAHVVVAHHLEKRGAAAAQRPRVRRAPRLRTPADHVDLPGASAAHVGWSSDHAARFVDRGVGARIVEPPVRTKQTPSRRACRTGPLRWIAAPRTTWRTTPAHRPSPVQTTRHFTQVLRLREAPQLRPLVRRGQRTTTRTPHARRFESPPVAPCHRRSTRPEPRLAPGAIGCGSCWSPHEHPRSGWCRNANEPSGVLGTVQEGPRSHDARR